jgi:hypothetical protein
LVRQFGEILKHVRIPSELAGKLATVLRESQTLRRDIPLPGLVVNALNAVDREVTGISGRATANQLPRSRTGRRPYKPSSNSRK